ncbi:MarR family transcriptional regulator [Micromonospora sp. NPDC049559]|uniref:MarR family winged helix-turn-helix transcriptional regulator n=1 Tax=Micromonospora sp. NPDC049559 TaxID=3155923 RepID=UPI003425DB6C
MERPDSSRLAAWQDFLFAHSRLLRELERELGEASGLSVAQYDVLLRLSHAPEKRLRMVDLSEAVLYTTGGVTRLIDRMAAAGLVTREPSPTDRRAVLAALTPAGEELLRQAGRVHLAGIQRHFGALLPDEELPAVARFLGRLARPGDEPRSADGCAPDSVLAEVDAETGSGAETESDGAVRQ